MASETDVAGGNGTVPSRVLDAGGVQHAVAILGSINIQLVRFFAITRGLD
jgi:hypothetical protein